MLTKMRPFDLQLFAEEGEPKEPETEEVTEDTGEPEPEEPETEEVEEETAEEPGEKPHDNVPLAKYMAEKKRRQELERQAAADKAEREKYAYKQRLVEEGWPETSAERQAEEHKRDLLEKEQTRERLLDYDIRDLTRSDEFYSDAETFADELKGLMRDKDLTAQQAYDALRGQTRRREMQQQIEQRTAAKRRKTQTKKVENATPAPVKSPYKLDDNDRKALEGLKKAQPDGEWTEEKYYNMMYGS